MKQLNYCLIICLFGMLTTNVFGSVTIGSNASVPVLNGGNVNSLFTVVDGVISQDIIVHGDLTIDLNGYIFNGISISFDGGDLTFYECGGPYLTFHGCTIEGGNEMVLEDSYLQIITTDIRDWFTVDLTSYSRIDIGTHSTLSDIFNVGVHDQSTFNGYQFSSDDAPISMEGVKTTVIFQECELMNNNPAAITLRGGGTYFGRENIFHDNEIAIYAFNPDGLFTWIKEIGSQIYDNMAAPIDLNDMSEIFLIDNEITTDYTGEYPVPIIIRGGSGATDIEGNIIHASDEIPLGIGVFNRKDMAVTGNYVDGIHPNVPQDHPTGIGLTMIGNLDVETNHVFDNTDATGINVSGCPGASVSTNYLTGNTRNINVLNSDGITLETNLCSYAGDANIMMTASYNATICNNACYYGADGIKLSGTNMMLEMATNYMSHCARGLVYMQNVLTNVQDQTGNTFVLNTLGAEFEDASNGDVVDAMHYVVRNISSEYPSHSPSDWFLNTGTTALDCTPMGPIPPIGIKPDVGRLIGGLAEVSPNGKCMNDVMIALRMIEAEPDFLEDEKLEDFYDTYHNTTLDKLPMIDEIFSICMDAFPASTPLLEIEEDGTLDNLDDQQDYMDELNGDYQDLVLEQLDAINGMIDDVSELEPENGYEESYQFAILQLLGLLKGDTLTTANESDIIDLAEGCITDDGPAIYIAQIIAAAEDLSYIRATSCTPVIPRSVANESQRVTQDISILPNPVSDYIELSKSIPGQTVNIYDVMGRLLFTCEYWTGRRLNLPDLQPGIYTVQLKYSDHPLRFMKS